MGIGMKEEVGDFDGSYQGSKYLMGKIFMD